MTVYSKGPWYCKNSFIGTIEEDTQTIAYLSDHRNRKQRTELETFANGLLISSAPSLFEALEKLLARLEDLSVDDWHYFSQDSKEIEEIIYARTLIHKIQSIQNI